MKKILITGFGPFDGDNMNPSEELIKFLNTKHFKNEVETIILPVTFNAAFQVLKEKFEGQKFDYVIMTGLAKDRKNIELEKIAINWIDSRIADNDGCVIKSSKINNDGPDGLFTAFDLSKILDDLNSNNFKISYSAGSFVCNYLYYKVLTELNRNSLFIHLPKTRELLGDENHLSNQEVFNLFFKFIELSF